MQHPLTIHLVSDSTGETLDHVLRACITQFDGVTIEPCVWSLIRHQRQLQMVLAGIKARPGMVLFTLVQEALRSQLMETCRTLQLPCVPVLEPVLGALSSYIGLPAHHLPGRQHVLDTGYYQRIEAMEFAIACDDGQGLGHLHRADIILLGVSRTSKTPTCLYLANRGLFAANIPIVKDMALPAMLGDLTTPLIVGLTRDPQSLVDIRRNRLRFLQQLDETSYANPESVAEEVLQAKRFCSKHGWPLLDVTRRSIEETAAEILNLLHRKKAP